MLGFILAAGRRRRYRQTRANGRSTRPAGCRHAAYRYLGIELLHSTQEKQSVKDRVKSGVANLRRWLVNIGDSMEKIDKLVGGHRNCNHYQNVIQACNRANFAIGEQGARRNDGYQTDLQGNRTPYTILFLVSSAEGRGRKVDKEHLFP